jgi:ribose transport system permease protein
MAGPEEAAKVAETSGAERSRLGFLRRMSIGRVAGALGGLIVVAAYLAATDKLFLSWGNVMNIFRAQSVIFILAIGMTFVILTGGLDLSVAAAAGFAGMILGLCYKAGIPPLLCVVICLISGIVLGVLNGVLIGMVRISPFVVTLGTMSIYTSVILVVTHGSTVSLFNYPKFASIQTLANGDWGPFPIILLVIVALYLIGWFILHRTAFGRAVYAVGSNSEAARLNGLNVPWTLLLVYTVAGLTYALGSIQQDGRLTAAVPIVDPNQMLAVIAAVLIGGMSMRGGEGGLLGTFVGVLFLGVIQNGLTLKGVSAFWQGTVTGLILIVAVGLAVARDTGALHRLRRSLFGRRKTEPAGGSE